MPSKQTFAQILALVVLVAAGAGLFVLTDGFNTPRNFDTTGMTQEEIDEKWNSQFPPLPPMEGEVALQEDLNQPTESDALLEMYIAEGYPTADKMSPDLKEFVINLYTQTDAFIVVDRMQFGESDEYATLIALSTLPSRQASCGNYGQRICFLLYERGDRTEILHVFQNLTSEELPSEWWGGTPDIVEILSMPFSGEILLYHETGDAGFSFRGWFIVNQGGQLLHVVGTSSHESFDNPSVDVIDMMAGSSALTFEFEIVNDIVQSVTVKDFNAGWVLLEVQGPWTEEPRNVVAPDIDMMIGQGRIYFWIGDDEFVFEDDGKIYPYAR